MNELLGFSDETYGNGSSVFFVGYMVSTACLLHKSHLLL